uniref:GLOBIN domain-containing protein n=1 Tax=Globodera pallida TaxID=36090 RepID=A0A183BZ95_GLOPA
MAFQEQDSAHLVENGEKLARFIKEFGFYSLEDKLFKEIEGQKSFKKFFKKFAYKNEVKEFANDFLHYQNLLCKMPENSRIDATVNSGATVIGQLAGLRYYALVYQALLAELDKPRNASGTTTAEKAWLKRWLRYSVAAIKASFNVVKNGMEDMLNADIYSHKIPNNSVQRKSNQQLLQTLEEWSAKLRR